MDLGIEVLKNKDALEQLHDAMENHVYPKAQAEAKELYRVGHKTKGALSRQSGEAMVSYVARRRRWWALLKSLDQTLELSTSIRGDLMLEAAKLSRIEQLLVLTSTNNNHEFDIIATALVDQHAKVHMGEKATNKEHNNYSKPHWRRQAHIGQTAEAELDSAGEETEQDEDAPEDGQGLETLEEVEVDSFTCFMCQECDDDDSIAQLVQTESTAFLAWNRFDTGKG